MGRVVIIDEDEAYCAGLAPIIAAHDVDVSPFQDGVSYLNSPIFEKSHVAVIAIGQATFNGLDLLRLSVERSGATHVFAVAENLDLKEIVAAVRMGASDVLKKPHSIDAIVRCALGFEDRQAAGLQAISNIGTDALSPREKDVLRRILHGKDSAAIAAELKISIRTVESHLAKLYAKCGVKNRAALIHKFKA